MTMTDRESLWRVTGTQLGTIERTSGLWRMAIVRRREWGQSITDLSVPVGRLA